MELRRYIAILWERWLLIAATVAVAVVAAYLVTPRSALYVAQSTIVVGPRQFSTESGGIDISGDQATGLERLTLTYAMLIDSEPIAADAATRAQVPRSAASVVHATTAVAVRGTQLLRVQFGDSAPQTAQAMANALADAFVDKVLSFRADQPAGVGTVPEVPVYVFERASLPTVPQPTGLLQNLVLGGLFGFLAAVGLVILLEYLDLTLRRIEDTERRLELPVLAAIPVVGPGTSTGQRMLRVPRVRSVSDPDRQTA